MNGYPILALVDTGAAISCVNDKLFEMLHLDQICDVLTDSICVQGVGGSQITKGHAKIPFTVKNLDLTVDFTIISSVGIDMLLGMDFIQAHRATIDFNEHVIGLFDNTIRIPLQYGQYNEAVVHTSTVIPPRHESVVELWTRQPSDQQPRLFEPKPSFGHIWNVLPAKTIAKVVESKFHVKILNPNDIPIELEIGTIVGYLEEIEGIVSAPQTPQQTVNVHTLMENSDPVVTLKDTLEIDLQEADVNNDERKQLATFLINNKNIFATSISDLGSCNLQRLIIDTGDNPPVRQRPYRVSPEIKAEIDKQVNTMLQNGIIRESTSPFASPVVMVKKKNGDYRFAIDYRKLNAITTTMNYPLPTFQDVTDLLGKAKLFSVMDMRSGFWQLQVDENSKHKTAFICHSGLFEFNRIPFGLRNSPIVFQQVMEQALRGMNYYSALVYVDDIITFTTTFKEHLRNLEQLFSHLQAANLKLHPSKCSFCVKEVTYLGHRVSKHGVTPDPKKIQVVKEYPTPNNVKDIRSFLGLANYYRRFVRGYSTIASPLTNLLAKEQPFQWTSSCEQAFQTLKEALTTAPILVYPDFQKQFILSTDASATAISFILSQLDEEDRERVISYGGRALHAAEKKWGISDRETLAVVDGIKAYRVYLSTKKFLVKTDHSAIQFIKKTKDPTGRLGRWAIFLQAYDFDVEYKPGKNHGNADSLSRRPYDNPTEKIPKENLNNDKTTEPKSQCEISNMIFPIQTDSAKLIDTEIEWHPGDAIEHSQEHQWLIGAIEKDTLRSLQIKDKQLKQMIDYLENGDLPDDDKHARRLILESHDHVINDGVLCHLWYPRGAGHKEDRVIKQTVVPHSLRNDILLSHHDSLMGGAHMGAERSYNAIRLRYYWSGMYADVSDYVKSCLNCQMAKRAYHTLKPPLCPLPVGELFQRWHMDFLGPLEPTDEGNRHILLLVDSWSKWCEAFAMKTTDAPEVAKVLYREIFCRFGAPETLLSDRGSNFISKLITELCRLFQVTRLRTSSYHAQTNAQCERFNSYLGASLRALCGQHTNKWDQYLHAVLSAYRLTPATQSTQFTPYFLLFKRECRLPIEIALKSSDSLPIPAQDCISDIIESFEMTQEIVKKNILQAQEKYTTSYNKATKPHSFVVGQKVWVYFPKVKVGVSTKLQNKWEGPFYICTVLKNNTFILRRSVDNKQLQSPIHAMRMKPFFDPDDRPTNPLPDIPEEPDTPVSEGCHSPEPTILVKSDHCSDVINHDNSKAEEMHDKQTAEEQTTNLQQPERPKETQQEFYEVDKIVASRLIDGIRHYKIKWKGYSTPTWEPEQNIPKDMKEKFHINKTNKGTRRKQPYKST